MAGFSDLKKMSKNSVSALAKELEKTTETKSYKDDRFWSPERGKDGNGYAVLRFLPACEGDQVERYLLPCVRAEKRELFAKREREEAIKAVEKSGLLKLDGKRLEVLTGRIKALGIEEVEKRLAA